MTYEMHEDHDEVMDVYTFMTQTGCRDDNERYKTMEELLDERLDTLDELGLI